MLLLQYGRQIFVRLWPIMQVFLVLDVGRQPTKSDNEEKMSNLMDVGGEKVQSSRHLGQHNTM